MENTDRVVRSREDFRHLPPRVTPEQMTPVQPVPHVQQDPTEGAEREWPVRMGWVG